MGRYQRYIYSGHASLYASFFGAACAALFFLRMTAEAERLRIPNGVSWLLLLAIPGAFVTSFTCAMTVILDPPCFKRQRVVYLRIANAAIIALIISFSVVGSLSFISKTID